MKIALIGYGKMGKAIDSLLATRGHQTVHIFNSSSPLEVSKLHEADVAIEFTNPESAASNILTCIEAGIPVIVGSTGWHEELGKIETKCSDNKGAIVHATNFSLGVNLFFKMNEVLAGLMAAHSDYEPKIHEIHHTEKLDSPSGTAITMAEGILTKFKDKTSWVNHETDNKNELSIVSSREPGVPGTHTVNYTSSIDSIELTHTAHNRDGFALGAIIAAEWIQGKTGIYTMRDVLNI